MEQREFTFRERATEGAGQKAPSEGAEKAGPKVYTVTELVRGAKTLLENTYPDVWVQGEVSGYKQHTSGHRYFILKDSTSILPAAIFKGIADGIKFTIEDGLELICHGRLSLYQRGGQYQLVVDYLEPKGVGELQLAFEQLKKKLYAEGLFDKAHKKPIPFLPRKIGVVTSGTGAAIRDILNILRRRFPNVEVLLVPVRVQGKGSAEEIAEGIRLLNERNDVDVMIVGRGGGSIEDLWAFNEELVARAIYGSSIPVVSAVGHEVDFTIADFVADLRAATPSAAAEHVVPVRAELMLYVERERQRLFSGTLRHLGMRCDKVREMGDRLKPPTRSFPEYYRYLDNLKDRMSYSLVTTVNTKRNIYKSLVAELNHLSPLNILSKGYAVVTKRGEASAIRRAQDLRVGDGVGMRFDKGSAEGEITKIKDG